MADDLRLARVVAEAALATQGVRSLGSGRYAEAATYGAGEKVSGVVVGPDEVEVHIVASYPFVKPIPELSRERPGTRRPRGGRPQGQRRGQRFGGGRGCGSLTG
jgi:hypothetical protein